MVAADANSAAADPTSPPVPPLPLEPCAELSNLVVGRPLPAADLLDQRLGAAAGLFRALQIKHAPTAAHSLRVALLSSRFCQHLGVEPAIRSKIEIAALLHDVGKIGVPDHILSKSGRLDADERAMMSQHANHTLDVLGACCADVEFLETLAFARTWFDGTYPENVGRSGEALPLGARVLAICDAFDAMTTDRVYRRAFSVERARAELVRGASTQFDPELVAAFCEACVSVGETSGDVVHNWVQAVGSTSRNLWAAVDPRVTADLPVAAGFQACLLDSLRDGVLFVDAGGRIVNWNHAATQLTGLSKDCVLQKQWEPQLVDLRDVEGNVIKTQDCPVIKCLRTQLEEKLRVTVTNTQEGVQTFVRAHVLPVLEQDAIVGVIAILYDLSSEQHLEKRVSTLHAKATKDALTGLNNRAELDRAHSQLLAEHSVSGEPLSLIITDIDRFKSINDTFGHQSGDQALMAFAQLIDELSREEDFVARYGGEEFVVLCPRCSQEGAVRRAEEIRRQLAATPQGALHQKPMTASFGVAEYMDGDTPETMLQRADRALYLAKERGRNRVEVIGGVPEEGDATTSVRSWFSWGRAADESVLKRSLLSNVPVNVVAEKIRGFVSDHGAEVLSAKDGRVSLRLDERALPAQRRQNDRPVTLTIHLDLAEEGAGTLVGVEFMTKRGRNRRLEDAAGQADRLLRSLMGYLIAEEV